MAGTCSSSVSLAPSSGPARSASVQYNRSPSQRADRSGQQDDPGRPDSRGPPARVWRTPATPAAELLGDERRHLLGHVQETFDQEGAEHPHGAPLHRPPQLRRGRSLPAGACSALASRRKNCSSPATATSARNRRQRATCSSERKSTGMSRHVTAAGGCRSARPTQRTGELSCHAFPALARLGCCPPALSLVVRWLVTRPTVVV